MAYTTLGVFILWFGWFGFNAGSTLSVDYGGVGFFAYVALNTNLAAAAGVLGAIVTSWLVIRKPDLSMMLNGAIGGLVAITAACAFVAPWAAIVIGFVRRRDRGRRRAARRAAAASTTPSARSPHTGCRASGARWRSGSSRCRSSPSGSTGARAACFYGGGLHQLGDPGARPRRGRRVHVHRVVRDPLADEGHRRDPHRARRSSRPGSTSPSTGCGAIPEFYIPVPGGYGTEHSVPAGRQFGDREVIVAEGRQGRHHVRRPVRRGGDRADGGRRRADASKTLKPGEFFGEMAIFENEVRSATVAGGRRRARARGRQEDRATGGSRTTPGSRSTC